MIRESEVKYCIGRHVPALAVELSEIKDNNDVYRAINCLTGYTKTVIYNDNFTEVMDCFKTAHELLHQGNRLVQLAVENIFIYSVSNLLQVSLLATQPVRSMFLKNFGAEYSKLINSRNP